MSLLTRIFLLLIVLSVISPTVIIGQHYIFIEADGQQPFYVKRADTLYSSSASGFLIIPKVPKGDFNILLGFPKAIYPEAVFEINEVSRDRGFHLKLFEGKGWGLFDRTSMEVIYSKNNQIDKSASDAIKKTANPFAALLSDATGDDRLIEQDLGVTKKQLAKDPNVEQPKKEDVRAIADKISPETSVLVKLEELETDKEKIISYIDRKSGGQIDTVVIRIAKLEQSDIKTGQMPVSSGLPLAQEEVKAPPEVKSITPTQEVKGNTEEVQSTVFRQLSACTKPVAEAKDMLNLQKKILGMAKEEDQLAYVEKVFGMKCFTSKQAVEVASWFLDENSRMNLFKRVYWSVSDHDDFKQAGALFFKEENIKAFKQLQSGN